MRAPKIMALFALLVCNAVLSSTGWAAPSLTLGTATGSPGQGVTIPVTFTNDGTVVSLQFDVSYSTSQLTAGTPTAGAALGSNGVASSAPIAGTRRIVITPTASNGLLGSGELVDLPFTIASGATAGNQTLTIGSVVLSNAAATTVAAGTMGNGQITVSSGGGGGGGADVCASGCDFASIQGAVNAAANGATVTVGSGTYHESLVITGGKTVSGSTGNAADVIIDASGLNTHAVQINGGTLTAVTVTGGNSTNGGGIYASGAATVHDTIIEGNTASGNGGGIWYAQYANVTIEHNTIRNNTAGGNGGGLYVINYSSVAINANIISGNSAAKGGGVFTESYCNARLSNLLIINNTAVNDGGGVYMNSYSYPVLINSTLSGNSGGGSSGISGAGYAYGTVINSVVWGNTSGDVGGGWGALTMSYSVTPTFGGTGVIHADPLFSNAASGDYHLTSGSPAIDTGTNTSGSGVTADLEGVARPRDGNGQGAGGTGDGSDYDVGAYEF